MGAIQQALTRGNMIELGPAVLAEFYQERSLDRFCAEVERGGGTILLIEDTITRLGAHDGQAQKRKTYRVWAVLPE